MGNKVILKKYAEAFKRQVVREYEEGASISSLQRKYGIGGSATIQRWVKRYGKEGLRTEQMLICSVEDQAELQQMRDRIQMLESALAESILDKRMLEAIIEAASEALNIDLKKDFGRKS